MFLLERQRAPDGRLWWAWELGTVGLTLSERRIGGGGGLGLAVPAFCGVEERYGTDLCSGVMDPTCRFWSCLDCQLGNSVLTVWECPGGSELANCLD